MNSTRPDPSSTTPTDTAGVTLAVLAGGRGSRMGAAKDRLVIAGKPVLVHLLDRLAHAGPKLLVAAADHPSPVGHERFDRIAFDAVAGTGPLAGVVAALAAATTPRVYVLSVDMPNVGPEQLAWLRDSLAARGELTGLLCERAGAGADAPPSVEPFPSIFRSSAASLLAAELAAGRRALHSLLDLPAFGAATVPSTWNGSVWLNLNRPDDLRRAGAIIL
ncbi:MAG: hypothetical protein JWO31_2377 [Phycisphaerales bacterium]|nr:hypothetical protein [Phycisphaerales bacterium]